MLSHAAENLSTRSHAPVANVPTELLGEANVLQPKSANPRERAEHLLTLDQSCGVANNGMGERLVLVRVRRAVDKEKVLFRRRYNDVQLLLPTEQIFNIGPSQCQPVIIIGVCSA